MGRLTQMNADQLSKQCIANILQLCDEFDGKYRIVLRRLLSPLRARSDALKMDYAYYRYKTMAMCTHSSTAIPATFAAQFGCVDMEKTMECDVVLWELMIDALQDDMDRFTQC